MSFISKVLNIVNENECIDLKRHTLDLCDEIGQLKNRIKSYIDDNYTDFLPNTSNSQAFLDESERILDEIENLYLNVTNESKIEVLGTLSDELNQHIQDLDDAKIGLCTSRKILKIDHLFQCIDVAKAHNEYKKIMIYVFDIRDLINDSNDDILKELDCFENINIRFQTELQSLLHSLKKEFESLVQLKEKSFEKTKSITIKISKDQSKLYEITMALINTKFNSRPMCDFLLNNVFKPIIIKPVSLEYDDGNSAFVQLTLSYSTTDLSDDLRPNYKTVFKNLKTTFQCLELINHSVDGNISIFSIIAGYLKEEFLKLLKSDCLNYSIPNTINEMNDSTMIDDIMEFNDFLLQIQFFQSNDKELIEFGQKIEILFQNRFCRNILDSAIEIMHKDLHDMMVTSDNTFTFPRCMISKSTSELVTLMDKVLHQSRTANEDIVERLLSTVPSILERYMTEMPAHHSKLLTNIPQQSALFHNNCNYLAHWTTKNSDMIESFECIMTSLQKLGSNHFDNQIMNQKGQILDLLKEFEPLSIENDVMPQKIIRQCLRQFDLLKNVWQTILPDDVYMNTMASLLNDFFIEIIRRIIIIEDIPSTVSNGLVEVLNVIIDRAPTVFEENTQIMIVVPKWMKLTQLKMILNASLAQIIEQWSDGKGPLTLNFKAEEVKSLIRALFQNTDRRANALFLIK